MCTLPAALVGLPAAICGIYHGHQTCAWDEEPVIRCHQQSGNPYKEGLCSCSWKQDCSMHSIIDVCSSRSNSLPKSSRPPNPSPPKQIPCSNQTLTVASGDSDVHLKKLVKDRPEVLKAGMKSLEGYIEQHHIHNSEGLCTETVTFLLLSPMLMMSLMRNLKWSSSQTERGILNGCLSCLMRPSSRPSRSMSWKTDT